jgi:hypothetical protein
VEKWILRFLLTAVFAIGIWAVAASVDDMKRYTKMRQM